MGRGVGGTYSWVGPVRSWLELEGLALGVGLAGWAWSLGGGVNGDGLGHVDGFDVCVVLSWLVVVSVVWVEVACAVVD